MIQVRPASSLRRLATLAAGAPLMMALALTSACKHQDNSPVQAPEAAQKPVDLSASCASDPRVMAYTPNMKVAGNSHNLTFVLTGAQPAPPTGGQNTWTVQILNAAGAPVTNYALTATPFMPDHAHGAKTAPVVAVKGDSYIISNIDLFMGGVWRTTLTAKDAQGNVVDAANVFFCVPG